MNGPLFLTGASGFVGRRVVGALAAAGHADVRLLARDPARLPTPLPAGWRAVRGTLSDPAAWQAALPGCAGVLHLAASTGKASRREHFAVNRDGTAALLAAAERAGVRRFLLVSSVAAGYSDRRWYHYAESKAAAEALVRRSAMEHLIVRPTLVLGPGSPLLASLGRLALLPVPLRFGAGRVEVQPIHGDDLAELLVAALALERWDGRIITAGGPQALPIRELLAAIRRARGRAPRAPLALPLGPLRALLGTLEPLLRPVLPFTAGQLAFFANPAVVAEPLPPGLPRPHRDLASMLEAA
jgi:nucleoside-diphosphate-sugar epimerase